MNDRHYETLAIHAGQEPDPATGAVITNFSLGTDLIASGRICDAKSTAGLLVFLEHRKTH